MEESKQTQDWSKSTVAQLKTELESRGLSAIGRKQELVSRLLEHDAENQPLPEDDDGLNPDAEDGDEEQAANLEEEEENAEVTADDVEDDDDVTKDEEKEIVARNGKEQEDEEPMAGETTEEQNAEEGGTKETAEEMEGVEGEQAEGEESKTEDTGIKDEFKTYDMNKLYIPQVKEYHKDMLIAHRQKSVYIYPLLEEDIHSEIFKSHLNKSIIYVYRFYKQMPKTDTAKTTTEVTEKKVEDASEVTTEEEAEKTETNSEKTSETKVEELTEDESKTTDTTESAMEETSKDETAGDVVAEVSKDGEPKVGESTEGDDSKGTAETDKDAAETDKDAMEEAVPSGEGEETTDTEPVLCHKGYLNLVFESYEDAIDAVKDLNDFREGVTVKLQDAGHHNMAKEKDGFAMVDVRESNNSANVVYIGHLPKSATEAELKSIFTTAKEIRIVRDEDQTMKGYAYAIYDNGVEAQRAASFLNCPVLDRHVLAVFYYKRAIERMIGSKRPVGSVLTDMERLNMTNRMSVLAKSKNKNTPIVQQEIKTIQNKLTNDALMKIKKNSKGPGPQSRPNQQQRRGPGGMQRPGGQWAAGHPQRPMWVHPNNSGQNQGAKRSYNNSAGNTPMNKRPRQQNYPVRAPVANYGQQRMGPGPRMGGPGLRMGGPGPRMGGPRPRIGQPNTVDLLVGLTQMLGNHLQGQQQPRPRHVRPRVQQNYMGQGRGWGGRHY